LLLPPRPECAPLWRPQLRINGNKAGVFR
jgi:hypothetical protein